MSGRRRGLVVAACLMVGALGARPAAAARTVALAPLSPLGIDARDVRRVQRWVRAALSTVSGQHISGSARLAQLLARRMDVECTATASCVGELARKVQVDLIVAGDVGRLGEGYVVYLRAINGAGKQVTAVNAVLDPKRALRAATRALAVQLLAPERYSGTLVARVDVPNAWIYLDGRRVARSPARELGRIKVGTHALRVTHPDYRDDVRFVQIDFERETSVEVKLSAMPVEARQMKLADRRPRTLRDAELPWYRRWWALAGSGAVLMTAAAVVVALIPREPSSDGAMVVNRP